MAKEELIPIASAAGAWAWAKYRDQIIDSIVTKFGSKTLDKVIDTAKGTWSKVRWEVAAEKYSNKIVKLYGTIRVLGKPEPMSLEGIFTDVHILDQPTAYRRYDIEKLREDPKQIEPDEVMRQSGLELVTRWDAARLFILGKPGAGKTTFLKYIALQATQGMLDKIPIFVSLKEWVDSGLNLMQFILKQFEICDFPDALPFVEQILLKGHAVVLFDGLDEVSQEEERRNNTISNIRDFSNQYHNAQCLITCRIAATDYTFEHFSYVEIADFSDEQIFTFARKWFKDDTKKYELFLKEISKFENSRLFELASVPILLTLLCLSFDETLEFPQRRVEVYEEAIDALLKKWDASRSIKRDEIYRGLTHNRKRQMLARVAAITFQQSKYFVPQEELSRLIVDFLRELPGHEPTADIDGESVLKAVEAQHGILSERAHRIYSFSHLTFQEYFAAKQVVDDASGSALRRLLSTETINTDRWREVILMTASLLDNAEVFFQRFRQSITELASHEPKVLELLVWADRKAQNDKPEGIAVGRLNYLSLALVFDTDRSLSRERATACQLLNVRLRELGHTLGTELHLLASGLTTLPLRINQQAAENKALDVDSAWDLNIEFEKNSPKKAESSLMLDAALSKLMYVTDLFQHSLNDRNRFALAPKFAGYYKRNRQLNRAKLGEGMYEALKLIIPPNSGSPHHWSKYAEDFRLALQINRDIAYEWRLTTPQVKILSQVLEANSLIYDCLQLAAVKDRTSIADSLLSPPVFSPIPEALGI